MANPQPKSVVKCCIKNCQKEIPQEEAIEIDGKYFCKSCGVHFYRNLLKL